MSAPIFKPTDQGLVRQILNRLKFFGGVGGKDHTELSAPDGLVFITAEDGVYLAYNARYDGTNWHRYDVSQGVTIFAVGASGALTMYTAAAGANPVSSFTTTTLTQGADSGWIAVGSYGTNWSAYTAPYAPYYRKLPNGMVIFRGLVAKSSALVGNETMFTMPAGFRPAVGSQPIFAVANSAATVTDLRADGATGAIVLYSGGSATWNSLANISYLAEG